MAANAADLEVRLVIENHRFQPETVNVPVGQTKEGLSVRVGRHLTGQRSDAVPHALTAVLVSDEVFKLRSNRDTRAARRAQTIASLS